MGSRTRRHLAAAGALVALAVSACSSGGDDASQSSAGSAAGVAAPAPEAGARDAATAVAGVDRTVVHAKSVIRTGEVTITSTHPGRVRDEVDALLTAIGGTVDNEQTTNDRAGHVQRSTVVIRVPVAQFEVAKSALMRMGTLKTSDESSKDVTTDVIDVDERVQTLQNSIDNLQRYQRRATTAKDLLDFEQKITTRQAELQSLTAQQSYLADQTSMATITLNLSRPEAYVPPPVALRDAGFLTGLEAGWHGLGDFVVVLLTVLGAILPFLLAGLLVAGPTWFATRALLRRRRGTTPAPATE